MSQLLSLEIGDLPPTVNMMYRNGKYSRYKRSEVEEWQSYVSGQMREQWGKDRPYLGEVEVRVQFITGTKRKWDVDNRLKALLDCLQMAGVIKDDSQISGLQASRKAGETSCTQIEVRRWDM